MKTLKDKELDSMYLNDNTKCFKSNDVKKHINDFHLIYLYNFTEMLYTFEITKLYRKYNLNVTERYNIEELILAIFGNFEK